MRVDGAATVFVLAYSFIHRAAYPTRPNQDQGPTLPARQAGAIILHACSEERHLHSLPCTHLCTSNPDTAALRNKEETVKILLARTFSAARNEAAEKWGLDLQRNTWKTPSSLWHRAPR